MKSKIFILSTLLLFVLSTSATIHLPPSIIESPDNLTYQEGMTGNTLSWTAEAGESNDNPAQYNITIDGSVLSDHEEASWQDNQAITVNVDGLAIGDHTVTLKIWDSGFPDNAEATTDSVTVSVVEDTATVSDTSEETMPLSVIFFIASIVMLPILKKSIIK